MATDVAQLEINPTFQLLARERERERERYTYISIPWLIWSNPNPESFKTIQTKYLDLITQLQLQKPKSCYPNAPHELNIN